MVDEQPARVLGQKGGGGRLRKVGESQEVPLSQAGMVKGCVHFRTQRKVLAGEVGDRDVKGVRRGVGAHVGEDNGGAERVQV